MPEELLTALKAAAEAVTASKATQAQKAQAVAAANAAFETANGVYTADRQAFQTALAAFTNGLDA